ncbi:MAG: ferric reductase-like transmembrane domain-containing protein [Actinobacteria bacterium]|nr:ferric reductase-like transmembrane domain-containing protein [Actinomycetota bacterium]
MNGITHATALWYASRATGVVSLVLLTLVVVLGVLVNRQGRLPGLPSFAVTGLHRSLSLLAVVFLAVHVITAVIDPFVTIGAAAILIPFISPYLPFWVGLGAVALDLVIALIITSLVRGRMPRRAWRWVHWLAYAAWPVAFAHGLGVSTDLLSGGLRVVAISSALAVGGALLWRVSQAMKATPRPERAAVVLARGDDPPRPSRAGMARGDIARSERTGRQPPRRHRPGGPPDGPVSPPGGLAAGARNPAMGADTR